MARVLQQNELANRIETLRVGVMYRSWDEVWVRNNKVTLTLKAIRNYSEISTIHAIMTLAK